MHITPIDTRGAMAGKHGGTLYPAQKGEVRNPRGKAKGTRSFRTILAEMMDKDIEVGKETLNTKEAIMTKLIASAMNGSLMAIKEIMDRLDGTPDSASNRQLLDELGTENISLLAELANRLAERQRELEQASSPATGNEQA